MIEKGSFYGYNTGQRSHWLFLRMLNGTKKLLHFPLWDFMVSYPRMNYKFRRG